MAIVIAIVGAAVLLDVYFENDPDELKNIQAESQSESTEQGGVYIIAQSSSISVKTSGEKYSCRKMKVQLHDRFLRKYHQLRNNQVLQAEQSTQTAPIIQSYHYLVFQHFFFTQPDEDTVA
jgi:hypothetical protein